VWWLDRFERWKSVGRLERWIGVCVCAGLCLEERATLRAVKCYIARKSAKDNCLRTACKLQAKMCECVAGLGTQAFDSELLSSALPNRSFCCSRGRTRCPTFAAFP
jgi:hypothetical protein